MTEEIEAAAPLTHMDGHLISLSDRETPMTIRPVSAYADDGPLFDPPTEEDIAARRKWADRHVAVVTIPIAVSPSPQSATPTYINPLAALRRERKVKSGKAAKLLGISRQRLHVVEHSSKPLRCMDRLLAKATEVWLVDDETMPTATPTATVKELSLSREESR